MERKDPGKIPNIWEYSDDVSRLTFKDSAEAHSVFAENIGIDGIVILGFFEVCHPDVDNVLVWIYLFNENGKGITSFDDFKSIQKSDISDKEDLRFKMALSPVFKSDAKLIPLISSPHFEFAGDFVMACEDGLYEPIITSTSEIAIRRIKNVLSEKKIMAIMDAQEMKVSDIHPVELHSPFEKDPVCIGWTIYFENNDEYIQWLPASYDDVEKLNGYSLEDLSIFSVNIGDKVRIGDENFVLKYEKGKGKFFELSECKAKFVPDKDTPNIIHFIPKKSKYLS